MPTRHAVARLRKIISLNNFLLEIRFYCDIKFLCEVISNRCEIHNFLNKPNSKTQPGQAGCSEA